MKAELLIDKRLILKNGKFIADIKVYKVEKSKKFPKGIKAKYCLYDAENGMPRLLIDNHEPFGFHMHSNLPEDKEVRISLDIDDYNSALEFFFNEVERIIRNEE